MDQPLESVRIGWKAVHAALYIYYGAHTGRRMRRAWRLIQIPKPTRNPG